MKEIRCPIVWRVQAAFLGFVEANGVGLGVTIIGKPGEWQVSAIETSKRNVPEIFDSHAHEFLGEFKDFEKARRKGTLYARDWLRAKQQGTKQKCGCGPIRKKEKKS